MRLSFADLRLIKPKPPTDAENVRINGNRPHTKTETQNDARGLRANTRQAHEPLLRLSQRHVPKVIKRIPTGFLLDGLQSPNDAFGLLVGQAGLPNEVCHPFRPGINHLLPVWQGHAQAGKRGETAGIGCVLAQNATHKLFHGVEPWQESGAAIYGLQIGNDSLHLAVAKGTFRHSPEITPLGPSGTLEAWQTVSFAEWLL